jgi:hypothetical protein
MLSEYAVGESTRSRREASHTLSGQVAVEHAWSHAPQAMVYWSHVLRRGKLAREAEWLNLNVSTEQVLGLDAGERRVNDF